jgi:hypothetical protein
VIELDYNQVKLAHLTDRHGEGWRLLFLKDNVGAVDVLETWDPNEQKSARTLYEWAKARGLGLGPAMWLEFVRMAKQHSGEEILVAE